MTSICNELTYKFSAYLDNELQDSEKKRIEEHLAVCSHCQSRFHELKKASDIISAGLDTEPNVDFDKVWQEIEGQIGHRPPLWQTLRFHITKPRFWIPAGTGGAFALIVILILLAVPVFKSRAPTQVCRVESVFSKTENVMVLKTAKTRQPIIWIMEKAEKGNSS